LAQLVGSHGRVHAFEPNTNMVELLQQTIKRNGFANITLHPWGLGAVESQAELSIPIDHAGRASLCSNRWLGHSQKVIVPIRTLDSLVDEIELACVRFVKIDVEGFELDVFRGGDNWLTNMPPEFILFECNEKINSRENDPAILYLTAKGYNIYAIEKTMLVLTLSPCNTAHSRSHGAHDFLAIHHSSQENIHDTFRIRQ
jgi:FkbM family methyltransferase